MQEEWLLWRSENGSKVRFLIYSISDTNIYAVHIMQDESLWVNERFENRIASGKSLQETSREFKHLARCLDLGSPIIAFSAY